MFKFNKDYRRRWVGSLLITYLIFIGFSARPVGAAGKIGPVIGYTAPDFTLKNLASQDIALSQVIKEHRVTLVNFWGIWCPYCTKEIPELAGFYGEYRQRGVEILAVDVGDNPQKVPSFVAENMMTFPVLLDKNKKVADLYQVTGYPRTFIIDRQGKIRDIIYGATNYAVLSAKVDALLKGEIE